MFDMDIKYPVMDSWPAGEQASILSLREQGFVEDANAAGARQLNGLTTEALDRLCALPWQGDTDELAEVIQQACQAADGPRIEMSDLPKRVSLLTSAAAHPPPVADWLLAARTVSLIDPLMSQWMLTTMCLSQIHATIVPRCLIQTDF